MRFYLICIFLSGLFFQTFSNNVKTVDSLFNASAYFDAAIGYERLIYFSNNYKEKNIYRYKKALCYKGLSDFDKAQSTLLKVNLFGLPNETRNAVLYETVLVAYLNEDYEQCAKTLLTLNIDSYNIEHKKILYLVATLNNIMINDFELSKQNALNYAELTAHKSELNEMEKQINAMYSKKNLPKLKKQKVFEWISIVPGMGQIYVGEIGEGLTNIALNLSAFSFGVYQIITGFYVTGYFVGSLSINKFYFGGRTRAKNAFEEVNSKRLTNFNKEIRNTLTRIIHLGS